MKHIHQVLKEITLQGEYDIPMVDKFLQTKKGTVLISKLMRGVHLHILEKELELPKLHTKDYINRIGLWKNRAKHLGLIPKDTPHTIIGYPEKFKEMKESGKLKLPHTLNKKELYEQVNSVYVRDENGKPIQQKDRRGRLLWNQTNNIPVYRRKSRTEASRGLSEALKCHLYELHKMMKWDVRHPLPSIQELQYDFFPADLLAAHKAKRDIYNEYVRNALAEKYCHSIQKQPTLKLFSVHKNVGYGGQPLSYEKEYNYPFSENNWLSTPDINSKLTRAIKSVADSNIVALKVYDKFGNERARMAA